MSVKESDRLIMELVSVFSDGAPGTVSVVANTDIPNAIATGKLSMRAISNVPNKTMLSMIPSPYQKQFYIFNFIVNKPDDR